MLEDPGEGRSVQKGKIAPPIGRVRKTEVVPDTTGVVNPAWRQLDGQIRRQNGLFSRELVQFAEIHAH
jgi:hypothetical protein